MLHNDPVKARIPQVLLVALALVVAVPGTAQAASKYAGNVDPSGRMSFKLEKTDTGKLIIDLLANKLPARCDEGRLNLFGELNVDLVVAEDGTFEYHYNAGGLVFDLTGTLQGGKAEGEVFESLDDVVVNDTTYHNCATKTLEWKAKRK